MTSILNDKRIILGVSGGIAAYKALDIARGLTGEGARVDVVMTAAAREFVTPLSFQALTHRPVHCDVFEPWTAVEQGHVSLAREADALVVAPATADVIAKLALGLADDMLTVTALACTAPLIIAPAMEQAMFLHAATQQNLRVLVERGARIVGPEHGPLASGAVGQGRLVSPRRLVAAVRAALGADGPLAGKHAVVSAGPTREPVDPIRFLSNRSSGKMGFALAEALIEAGAKVTLVTGPTWVEPPAEAEVIAVETAAQMAAAVSHTSDRADILIMAAAVADYRPAEVAQQKIKKTEGDLVIRLTRTTDIIASINRPGLIKVGFAAETADLLDSARRKLATKGMDMIVANEAVPTMGSDVSGATLILKTGETVTLAPRDKLDLARAIVERIVQLVTAEHGT